MKLTLLTYRSPFERPASQPRNASPGPSQGQRRASSDLHRQPAQESDPRGQAVHPGDDERHTSTSSLLQVEGKPDAKAARRSSIVWSEEEEDESSDEEKRASKRKISRAGPTAKEQEQGKKNEAKAEAARRPGLASSVEEEEEEEEERTWASRKKASKVGLTAKEKGKGKENERADREEFVFGEIPEEDLIG